MIHFSTVLGTPVRTSHDIKIARNNTVCFIDLYMSWVSNSCPLVGDQTQPPEMRKLNLCEHTVLFFLQRKAQREPKYCLLGSTGQRQEISDMGIHNLNMNVLQLQHLQQQVATTLHFSHMFARLIKGAWYCSAKVAQAPSAKALKASWGAGTGSLRSLRGQKGTSTARTG